VVVVDCGFDLIGVSVFEVVCFVMGLLVYVVVFNGYVLGMFDGVVGWLVYCVDFVVCGVVEGSVVVDVVLAGCLFC